MIVSRNWIAENNARRPDVPDSVTFRVVRDHGDTCEVEILSGNWPPKTLKSDIWRRATDQEAEVVDQILSSQPVRMRRMWDDSRYLGHLDELFPLVRQAAVEAFGEARADELLAPSDEE